MCATGARPDGKGSVRLSVSYVQKNTAAIGEKKGQRSLNKTQRSNTPPGALPTTTLPTPLYIPLNPPALTKP